MLHTIQAELYQLVRSRLFWLIEGLLFFLIFISSLGERNFNFYISTSSDPEEIIMTKGRKSLASCPRASNPVQPWMTISSGSEDVEI